ncbi:ficolin-2-like [Topomyia yanbarensis]|uniref:ficolin-2-like n=1 Tax=Topomyia yanbarensis TaxID=2498891 RepID=UPI00273B0904|nr:ficolin-2-like [Topomyia yanbarensis]
MAKHKELLPLLVFSLLLVDHRVHGQSCQDSNKTGLDNVRDQIRLLENEIGTLTDVMQHAAWSIINLKATLGRIKSTMDAMVDGDGSSNETTSCCSESGGADVTPSTCANMNMADLLAQYFNEHMVIEIKFSNGSSVISGCNGTMEQEQPTGRVVNSCQEAHKTGTYILNHNGNSNDSFSVRCDADYEAGGWVVMQHRYIGTVDFYRNWTEYKQGFGDFDSEFWLGNDKIYQLTKNQPREIHFILTDWDDRKAVAKYSSFQIGNEEEKYVLKSVGNYSGTAGDSLSRGLHSKFSTQDQDNDSYSGNCASLYHGAWWYEQCHLANLNGKYARGTVTEYATSMGWQTFMGYYYGLKTSKIMIRI